jgi:adenylate cyclase
MPSKSFSFRLKISILALLITLGLAAVYLTRPPVVHQAIQALDAKLLDLQFKLRGSQQPAAPVVVAVLDEKSLKKVGRWPWPRPVMADLLRALGNSGAAVVGLDLGFFDKDTALALSYLSEEQQSTSHDPKVNAVLDRLKGRLSGGNQLAKALRESPVPMVLGYFLHMNPQDAGLVEEHVRNRRRTVPLRSSIKLLNIPDGVEERFLPLPESYLVEPNLEELNQAAELMGFLNLMPDPDGLVRKAPLVIRHARPSHNGEPAGYDYYPSLALNMLRAYLGRQLWTQRIALKQAQSSLSEAANQGGLNKQQAANFGSQLSEAEDALSASWSAIAPSLQFSPSGVRAIKMGGMHLDTTPFGELRLNLRGPGAFEQVSWVDLMDGSLPPGALKDKLVVVGGLSTGPDGGLATALDPHMPSCELHATALDNLISRQWLRTPAWSSQAGLYLILGLGLLGSLLLPFASARWGVIIFVILAGGFMGFAHLYAFSARQWMLPTAYPLLTLLLVFGVAFGARHLLEDKQRRRTRQTFSRHVSDSVIEQVLDDPQVLKLEGQRRELSIFYSDLRGFGAISEHLEPEALTSLLNEYLSEMSGVILDEAGTLDKYQGDAIIAFWNAPLDQPGHAKRAVRAALECQERLNELRPRILERTGVELFMRIGINTGQAVVGNLGSDKRFEYTVMGDAAKLASRLEEANQVLGSSILISQATWEQAREAFVGREAGKLLVLGRRDPLTVYEPLGPLGSENHIDLESFAKGLALIREGNPVSAIKVFEKLQDDPVGAAYYNRLRRLAEAGEGWRGVWRVGG